MHDDPPFTVSNIQEKQLKRTRFKFVRDYKATVSLPPTFIFQMINYETKNSGQTVGQLQYLFLSIRVLISFTVQILIYVAGILLSTLSASLSEFLRWL